MRREAILYFLYQRMTRSGRRLLRFVRPSGWVAMGLGLLLFMPSNDPTRSPAYQVLALLTVMLFCDFLSLCGRRPRAEARRVLPTTCVPGQAVTIEIVIRNVGRRGWHGLRVQEEAPLPLPTVREFALTPEPGERKRNLFDRVFIYYRFAWLGERHLTFRSAETEPFDLVARQESTVRLELMPLRRGHLSFERMSLVRDGLFGFFRRSWRLEVPVERVPVVPAPGAPLAAPAGATANRPDPAGLSPQHRSGQSDEFLTLRDYRPGDPLQHIHWASFARAGHPIVREFEDVFRPRVAMILDTLLPREGKAFELTCAFEHALVRAAAFAARVESGETLLELLLVQEHAHSFTCGPGHLHLRRILEIMAGIQPTTIGSLSPLERLAFAHARQCQSALFVSVQWDDERERFLSRLQARGLRVEAVVVWPTVGQPPPEVPPQVHLVLPRAPKRGQFPDWSPPRPVPAQS